MFVLSMHFLSSLNVGFRLFYFLPNVGIVLPFPCVYIFTQVRGTAKIAVLPYID